MWRFATALCVMAPLAADAQTLRIGLLGQDMGTTDPHRASATQDKAPGRMTGCSASRPAPPIPRASSRTWPSGSNARPMV